MRYLGLKANHKLNENFIEVTLLTSFKSSD